VDPRSRRRPGDERTLPVQPASAWSGELDEVADGTRAAFLREPEQRDEDLGRCERVRQRAMAGLDRNPEEVCELGEREALAPAVEETAREPHRVDDRRRAAAPGQPFDGMIEERHVEA